MVTAIIKGRTETATAIIEAPPRHGKTELISKWLPVWFLIRWPNKRLIMTTATHKLARKLGRNARDLFREHAPAFGLALSDSQSAADEWETSKGGGMLAAGVGGPIMGRGADLLILDDPIRNGQDALSETVRDNQWDWWQSTASTRLEPNGKTIVVSTRWHEDDIAGRILKAAAADGGGEDDAGSEVARLTMPAIAGENDAVGRKPGAPLWPERFPLQRLERIRAKKSRFWWNSLFQQNPGKWGDSRWEDYLGQSIWAARWPEAFEASIVAVDPSLGLDDRKGDFSAVVFVGISGGKLWVDASLERRPVTKIATDSIAMALRHRAGAVALEANGFQQVLAPAFQQAAYDAGAVINVVLLHNRIKKELRIDSLEPHLAAGRFVFRDSPGCRLLVDQLGEFPRGDHDDGCLIAGTMIETDSGARPIESVNVGDLVLTRNGFRRVVASGMTGVRPVVELGTADGRKLTGTGNHPVFDGVQFVPLESTGALAECESIRQRNRSLLNSMGSRSGDTRTQNSGLIESTSLRTLGIAGKASALCTKRFGNLSTGRFQRECKFTTLTATRSTMRSRILRASKKMSTTASIMSPDLQGCERQRGLRRFAQSVASPVPGTGLRLGSNGTEKPEGSRGRQRKSQQFPAYTAEIHLKRHSRHVQSFARHAAGREVTRTMVDTRLVPVVARRNLAESPVFNLTVEGCPEYFANGFLVHNCDALEMAVRGLNEQARASQHDPLASELVST